MRSASRLVLVLRVLWTLVRVEWLLRRGTLPRACRQLGLSLEDDSAENRPTPGPDDARTIRAVYRVTRFWPFGDTCLRQCLSIGHLLQAYRPVLRLGVRRLEDGSISAHSWLELSGHTLDPSSENYEQLPMR